MIAYSELVSETHGLDLESQGDRLARRLGGIDEAGREMRTVVGVHKQGD